MSSRIATWLAWSLFGLYILTVVATLGLVAFAGATSEEVSVFIAFGFALSGALIAAREPTNSVGWLLLGTAVDFGLYTLAQGYIRQAGRPGEGGVGWLVGWSWFVWLYVPVVVLPLVFPNGRLLSPRWRIAVWIGCAAIFLTIMGYGFVPGELDIQAAGEPTNPLGFGGRFAAALPSAVALGTLLAATGLILGVACLVLRFRRSRGRERQQLKVFAYVGTLALAGLLLGVPDAIAGESSPLWAQVATSVGYLSAMPLIFFGIPIAIGVAILRHQLYGIDVVINRTLVYGALTVSLGVVYFGLVVLFELLLKPVTNSSDLAVAGSTLAVAALFRPARNRIQSNVDRRFYRARFDASRTLDAFAVRLRDELDLETVAADLQGATRDTLQPAHVSLWLREPDR